jgi:hypothetical protein
MDGTDSSPSNLYDESLNDESVLTQQHEQIHSNPALIQTITKPCFGLCAHAVSLNGLVLEFIDEPNHEICRIAVNQNPHALKFVRRQTFELCHSAVSVDGLTIQYVNEQTNELCLTAVKQNPVAFMFIRNAIWLPPEEYINPILGTYIIKKSPFNIGRIKNQYHELCLLAVALNGMTIREIRDQVEDVCAVAVNQNGMAITHILNQTPELCHLAIQKTPSAFSCIREPTYEISLEVMRICGSLLYAVRTQFRTPELLMAAIKNDCEALKLIKAPEQTPELCMFCVKRSPMTLRYVHDKTPEICKCALALDGRAIQYIDKPSDELCQLAIKSNWTSIALIINPSKELCDLALSISKDAIKYIRRSMIYKPNTKQDIVVKDEHADNVAEIEESSVAKNENTTPIVSIPIEPVEMRFVAPDVSDNQSNQVVTEMNKIDVREDTLKWSTKSKIISEYKKIEQEVIPVNPIPKAPSTFSVLNTDTENEKPKTIKKPVDKDVFKFFTC